MTQAFDFEQWAAANIVFTERESSLPGPYDPKKFPYFSEIWHALSPSDPCRKVTVKGSAQVGKTTLATVFTLASFAADPCDLLYAHPTLDNAKRWSRLKLAAFLERASVELASNQILFKSRADGRGAISVGGASSMASLSNKAARRQVHDDLSRWTNTRAGDPEVVADCASFGVSGEKILKVSTPFAADCRISRSFMRGSQESFYVPCPHCGTMQTLEFENFFPRGEAFVCVAKSCHGFIEDSDRWRMLPHGEWRAMNPAEAPYHRSFEIWAAYSPICSFERIAREYLDAKGSPEKLRVFQNDILGRG